MIDETPLSAAARALLAAHGRTLSPPHDGAAVLAATRARLATAPASAPMLRRARWLTLVGTASVLIGASWLARPDAEVSSLPRAFRSVATTSAEPAPLPTATPAQALPGPVRTPVVEPPAAVRTVASVRTRGAARAPAPAVEPEAGLADELALLTEARVALARGEHTRVAAAIEAHRRRHPEGRLRGERIAMAVMLACAEHRPDAASEARTYLEQPASTPYRARVRAACKPATPE